MMQVDHASMDRAWVCRIGSQVKCGNAGLDLPPGATGKKTLS